MQNDGFFEALRDHLNKKATAEVFFSEEIKKIDYDFAQIFKTAQKMIIQKAQESATIPELMVVEDRFIDPKFVRDAEFFWFIAGLQKENKFYSLICKFV